MVGSITHGSLTAWRNTGNCMQSAPVSRMWFFSMALYAVMLPVGPVRAQDDSLQGKTGMEEIQLGQLPEKNGDEAAPEDSLPIETGAEAAQKDSAQEETVVETTRQESVQEKTAPQKDTLKNIALGNKRVRAYGWGEYRVGGRCLCCDNKNDGDCIVVHTIERTDRLRIPQITDGTVDGDANDDATYFGNLRKRDLPEPAAYLMADISLGKVYEIRKVIVYTIIDKEKHTNYLSNCELGYYDQFNRLQWMGRVKNKKYNEPITFEMENPVLTKAIMLRVKDGKSRITEIAIFCDNGKEQTLP